MLRPLMLALLGTSFTFLMTALGAATVFFFARKVCERAQGALLGFAAGAMLYVVAAELLPTRGDPGPGALAFAAGFTVMMILDVALG